MTAGGEGGGAWEVKKAKAHLWVALELERRAGDGVSTASGGDWSSATAAGWFPWGLGEEKRSRSGARTRQSYWWGL